MTEPKRTKPPAKDWRNRPLDKWNVATIHSYISDINYGKYGISYVPMRNWRFEQGVIKRFITKYGADMTKKVIDAAFAEYQPTQEYPIMNAGFALNYAAGRVLPRLLAEEKAIEDRKLAADEGPNIAEKMRYL